MSDKEGQRLKQGILKTFSLNQLSLRHFVAKYVISPQDIEDVTQETFLRAYRAEQEKDTDIKHPKAFLFRIAKNLLLSEMSKKSTKVTDYIDNYEECDDVHHTDDLELDIMAQQKLGIYCEALASLPQQRRKVILMKKVYAMQNKEIACKLGLSVSTVEKHISKGIAQLYNTISVRYGDDNAAGTQKVNAGANK